jgi:hypothetical protein
LCAAVDVDGSGGRGLDNGSYRHYTCFWRKCEHAILSDHRDRHTPITPTKPVTQGELEAAIRAAIKVLHVEVQDNSGGFGEKYSVLIVSQVLSIQIQRSI